MIPLLPGSGILCCVGPHFFIIQFRRLTCTSCMALMAINNTQIIEQIILTRSGGEMEMITKMEMNANTKPEIHGNSSQRWFIKIFMIHYFHLFDLQLSIRCSVRFAILSLAFERCYCSLSVGMEPQRNWSQFAFGMEWIGMKFRADENGWKQTITAN